MKDKSADKAFIDFQKSILSDEAEQNNDSKEIYSPPACVDESPDYSAQEDNSDTDIASIRIKVLVKAADAFNKMSDNLDPFKSERAAQAKALSRGDVTLDQDYYDNEIKVIKEQCAFIDSQAELIRSITALIKLTNGRM